MRINLLAGPGAGKSTTAAWLFSELKTRNVSVELITEYVKSWAVQKRNVTTFDQVYLFAKQMQYEYRFINNGIKNIITDSPLALSCVYGDFYYPELKLGSDLLPLLFKYEKMFPSINIYLDRKDKKYISEGRYQTYDQAIEVDNLVRNFIKTHLTNVHYLDYSDRRSILELVLKHINK